MKIKASQLDPQAQRTLRHVVSMYQKGPDIIVRPVTGASRNNPSPKQSYQRAIFGLAGRMTSYAIDLDRVSAAQMVEGALMVPRDFLTACIFGTGIEIHLPDGRVSYKLSHFPEEPTFEDDHMFINVGAADPFGRTQNSASYAQLGMIFALPWSVIVQEVYIFINVNSGGDYRARFARVSPSDEILDFIESDPVSVTGSNVQLVRFPLEFQIDALERVAIISALVSGTGTTPNRSVLQAGIRPLAPLIAPANASYNTTTLTNGQTPTAAPSNGISFIMLAKMAP